MASAMFELMSNAAAGNDSAVHGNSVFDRKNLRLLPLTVIMIGLIRKQRAATACAVPLTRACAVFTMLFEKLIHKLDLVRRMSMEFG